MDSDKSIIADAGPLVAYLKRDAAIFTLDSDFKIYRRHGRQAIPLIFPE